MPQSAIYDALAADRARMGEYCGAETAAGFGNVAAEFETLRSGCAVYDLAWRAKLIVAGPDRVRWMNGMVTNNIKDLPLHRGSYNLLLNAQGRIQGDMYVYNRGEYLLVDTDVGQRGKMQEIFEKFIIMDDVEISDASQKIVVIGLEGPACAEVLKRSAIAADNLEELEVTDLTWNGIGLSVVRQASPRTGYELWLAPQNAMALWNQLVASGAKPVGTDALELFRISRGIPRYGQDIRERDLPQETAQDQALDFQKGCYVGQEIVERIHSRGNVHRTFIGLTFASGTPAAGTKIQAAGKEVGEVTSVAALSSSNGQLHLIGLGYLRREAAESNVELRAGEASVTATALPFKNL